LIVPHHVPKPDGVEEGKAHDRPAREDWREDVPDQTSADTVSKAPVSELRDTCTWYSGIMFKLVSPSVSAQELITSATPARIERITSGTSFLVPVVPLVNNRIEISSALFGLG
jgi:hypothetical protein